MRIQKRNGTYEQLSFDKIIRRLQKLCQDEPLGLLTTIDPDIVAQKVVSGIYDGVTSSELDEEAARIAVSMSENMEYQKLASRIIISNHHKSTDMYFSNVMNRLFNNYDKNGEHAPIVSDEFIEITRQNKSAIEKMIDYKRDYLFDYFGFKTLEKNGKMKCIERPQHLYMRVAIALHKNDLESVKKTYDYISQHYYTHASPTLFNAGTRLPNYASCFLMGTNDSIEGIFKTITDCGLISKVGGGIGVHISNIRAKGSIIRGTNGVSDGIIPMIKVYNSTCAWVNQYLGIVHNSGRRKGSFAMYLEPWHADIFEFLDLKKSQGHDDLRARDLFYAIWTPDLFMKQVKNNDDWYLMCPDECPGLTDTYGEDFEKLYWSYVDAKKYRKVVSAQDLWKAILMSIIETGTPYVSFKDHINRKYDNNYATCNLCSIALPKFVDSENGVDHTKLYEVAYHTVKAMNQKLKKTNIAHRPLGIGVQGLADVFFKLKIPFESKEAKKINREIFETIYYATLKSSIDEAKKHGPYSSYKDSPFSQGLLQMDLAKHYDSVNIELTDRWDWDELKSDLKKYGIRNSMLTALMPTASTAQIMGNTESFEPIDSCIFNEESLQVKLTKLGLWNKELKDIIVANNGSIQGIKEIPNHIKEVYKTVWELSMRSVIEMASERGVFVDQMQSMNLFMDNPNLKRLGSMLFYSWNNNLKTGMYYLRQRATIQAGKFSVDAIKLTHVLTFHPIPSTELSREEIEELYPKNNDYKFNIDLSNSPYVIEHRYDDIVNSDDDDYYDQDQYQSQDTFTNDDEFEDKPIRLNYNPLKKEYHILIHGNL
ncbi:putative ribonucleoside-diphosphate reductase large chain [Zopfochytrium polystomum]|nr:putative ribonucleoside-diphosphate reductase large chain [Zopfochytrium polystomum]